MALPTEGELAALALAEKRKKALNALLRVVNEQHRQLAEQQAQNAVLWLLIMPRLMQL